MSKKNGTKKSKTFTLPKVMHVINLGTQKNPEYVVGDHPTAILNDWETKGQLVGTYELVGTDRMKLTQTVEVI